MDLENGYADADAVQEVVPEFGDCYVDHTGTLRSKSTITAINVAVVVSVNWVGSEPAVGKGSSARSGQVLARPSACKLIGSYF